MRTYIGVTYRGSRRTLIMRYVVCVTIAFCSLGFLRSSPGKAVEDTTLRVEKQRSCDDCLIDIPPPRDKVPYEKYSDMNSVIGVLEALDRYGSEDVDFDDIRKRINDLAFTLHKKLYVAKARNSKYVINPSEICDNDSLFLLTIIHSAPWNFEKRSAIRETWGNGSYVSEVTHKLVFVIGHDSNASVNEEVKHEAHSHGDILYIDFHDSYQNLTYKALTCHKWIMDNCMHARFVLKTDDDAFVNIFSLVTHLQSLTNSLLPSWLQEKPKNMLLCKIIQNASPFRGKSKWYVSWREFPFNTGYPPYCPGVAYVMTPDVVEALYKASTHTHHLWIDDVYITGILAVWAGVKPKQYSSVYVHDPERFFDEFTGPKGNTYLFGWAPNANQIRRVWDKVFNDYRYNSTVILEP